MPVEFIFNLTEMEYAGGTIVLERQFNSALSASNNNSDSQFISIDGDIIRRTVTITKISETGIDQKTIASSGGNGIVFRKVGALPITHEIIHNFFSCDETLSMGNSA